MYNKCVIIFYTILFCLRNTNIEIRDSLPTDCSSYTHNIRVPNNNLTGQLINPITENAT